MSQAGTISNWYTNAYGAGFRTTRLRANSIIPNNRLAQAATAQQTLVVDAARGNGAGGGPNADKEDAKNVRRRETVFGPDVGEDDEPGWIKPDEGAKVSVDVVKNWVEKAKNEEGLHATTTLQAMVNLKRPTLQLQQLDPTVQQGDPRQEGDITSARDRRGSMPVSAPSHLLKFNYDATVPNVYITLSIHPTPAPVIEGKESFQEEEEIKTVYEGFHGGGFNQVFQLPASSALDLSAAMAPIALTEDGHSMDGDDFKDISLTGAGLHGPRDPSMDTNRSSMEQSMGNLHIGSSTQPDLATVPEGAATPQGETRRTPRRFGIFPRRQREPDVEEAAQIEMQNRAAAEGADKTEDDTPKEPEKGMRLLIKIEALGSNGEPLRRRNAQLTHILVNGIWSADGGAGQERKRMWVVKVVRREAVIGAHTFLLKEIYGLSSASTSQPEQSTSYPPTGEADPYAFTPNECIVCLTAPRDVVLLPCRHLVVCRECAVGMVEFGAGGKVARREDGAAAEEAGGATAATASTPMGNSGSANAPPVAGGTTANGRERRKRKAKGWYCPVCRQPYTSLLRLALPSTGKPEDSVELEHEHAYNHQAAPSLRAPSIRSVRSTHTLRRAPSIAPTLPDGAEQMLDGLRPRRARGEDDDEYDYQSDGEEVDHEPVPLSERPQFVLGPEVDDGENHHPRDEKKAEVQHREVAGANEVPSGSSSFVGVGGQAGEESRPQGWKEAAI